MNAIEKKLWFVIRAVMSYDKADGMLKEFCDGFKEGFVGRVKEQAATDEYPMGVIARTIEKLYPVPEGVTRREWSYSVWWIGISNGLLERGQDIEEFFQAYR